MSDTPILVPCTHCGTPYPASPGELGRQVQCPHCGTSFTLARTAVLDEQEQQIAALAVRLKLFAPEPSTLATLTKAAKGPRGARFVAAGLLTQAQLDHLLATLAFKEERVADTRFGALAVQRGWATNDQIVAALEEQKRIFMREARQLLLGALLIEQKVLTQAQCDDLLAAQERAKHPTPAAAPHTHPLVVIASDRMSASLTLPPGNPLPTVEQLQAALAARHVRHGIDPAKLAAIASGQIPAGQEVVVATGTPPEPPQSGTIEYLFDTHPLRGARERGEGLIDYRDRGEIPQVAAGTVLARATPSKPGRAGANVLGQPLAPPKVKDLPLRVGKGAELAADKLSATATIEGRPSLSEIGILSVYPEYEIKGDVDLSTGHVSFHGRVVVSGAVRSGFRVRCGELVAQEIEGADVEAEGDVTVAGGVIRARVRAGGALRARYLHQSKVEALGNVIVAREVVDSQVETSGVFESPECTLLASRVSAMNGIQAREIGSDSSSPCHLVAGVDERVQHETARLQHAIEEQVAACDKLQKEIDATNARNEAVGVEIGPLAQQQDRALVRLRELTQAGGQAAAAAALKQQSAALEAQLNACFAEQDQLKSRIDQLTVESTAAQEILASLKAELEQLHAWAATRATRFLVRADTIHQQTLITGPHLEARLENDRKAANLVERERIEHGHSNWVFASN